MNGEEKVSEIAATIKKSKAEMKAEQRERKIPRLRGGGNDNRHRGYVMPFVSVCYVLMKS